MSELSMNEDEMEQKNRSISILHEALRILTGGDEFLIRAIVEQAKENLGYERGDIKVIKDV